MLFMIKWSSTLRYQIWNLLTCIHFFIWKKAAVMLANKQSSWIIKPPLRSSLKSLFFFNLADRSDAIADTCVAKGTTGPCRQWHWVLWLYVCHWKLAAIEISEFATVWYLAWNAVPGGNCIIVGNWMFKVQNLKLTITVFRLLFTFKLLQLKHEKWPLLNTATFIKTNQSNSIHF